MKVYQLHNQWEIPYPIGSHIDAAITYINKVYATIILNELFKNRDINLWCRGSSGAILAGLLASRLLTTKTFHSVQIIHVKKPNETAHGSDLTYVIENGCNIIIDDFSYTGDTIIHITKSMTSLGIRYVDAIILSAIHGEYAEDIYKPVNFAIPRVLLIGHLLPHELEAFKVLKPKRMYIPRRP